MTDALTDDAFLGGRLHLLQPRKGFRAGVDAVILAASCPAKGGDSVLELGCGVGTATLCLGTRVPDLDLTAVELLLDYADLARRNADRSGISVHVATADLRALPTAIRTRQFGHVIMNPPYFDRTKGTQAQDVGRDTALAGDTDLTDWIDIGLRRLAPKGSFTMIQHISRLPEVLSHISGRLGSAIVRPISGRRGNDPGLFVLQGKLSGKAPFLLRTPWIMHEGDAHDGDAESYTPMFQDVLRNGHALSP